MSDVNAYGVTESTISATEAEERAEEVLALGYTVLESAVSEDAVAIAAGKLDSLYVEQAEAVGGEEALTSINDANIVRAPLVADAFFLDAYATNARVLRILERLLGSYFVLQQQNGVLNPPDGDNYQTAWHRDLPYQHFTTSKPIAVSVLHCVNDFNEKTGGTCVLPATHKIEAFPSEQYILRNEQTIVAPAGSALIFDSLLFHRAGVNRSDHIRRGLNHVYGLPFLNQQISLPQALGREIEDPFLRKLLGYETEAAGSAREWRERRLERVRSGPTV